MDMLSRLNADPDPAIVAERPQRMQERLLFRAMIADCLRNARR